MFTAFLAAEICEQQGQFHILIRGQDGNQIEALKDEADVDIAPLCNLFVG